MIAVDTSTWIAFFEGATGEDTRLLDEALANRQLVMVPAVLVELLSDPQLPADLLEMLCDIPLVEPTPGFWQRAGILRAKVLGQGRKARLGDALVAQCCIDGDIRLITRDRDFQAFAAAAGLRLVIAAP